MKAYFGKTRERGQCPDCGRAYVAPAPYDLAGQRQYDACSVCRRRLEAQFARPLGLQAKSRPHGCDTALAQDLERAGFAGAAYHVRRGEWVGAAWRMADEILQARAQDRALVEGLGRRVRRAAADCGATGMGLTKPTGMGAILPSGEQGAEI